MYIACSLYPHNTQKNKSTTWQFHRLLFIYHTSSTLTVVRLSTFNIAALASRMFHKEMSTNHHIPKNKNTLKVLQTFPYNINRSSHAEHKKG